MRFWLAAGAAAATALTLAAFFLWIFPGSQATQNWTVAAENWRALRVRWEYGHAVNAVITFAAFCALTAAAFVSQSPGGDGP